jgi:hypothetical protein
MRTLMMIALVFGSSMIFAQSNLVFSVPKEYDTKISIAGFNSTKPQTWQVKFQNIPQGTVKIVVTVTKPGLDWKDEVTYNLAIERGYEYTYFITPYKVGSECHLANAYTLEQVYGKNSDNQPTTGDVRVTSYDGRPVLSLKDLADFVAVAAQQKYGSNILEWLKKQMPAFYFYTDDIVRLVYTLQYDSDKLVLAKFAYDYTIDKQLYFKLGKTFQYTSTAEELTNYIAGRR